MEKCGICVNAYFWFVNHDCQTQEPNVFRHYLASTAERDGILFSPFYFFVFWNIPTFALLKHDKFICLFPLYFYEIINELILMSCFLFMVLHFRNFHMLLLSAWLQVICTLSVLQRSTLSGKKYSLSLSLPLSLMVLHIMYDL